MEHSSFDSLIGSITEKKVLDLSFKGMVALNDYLKRRFAFELFDSEEDLYATVEAVELRNLFVHNRGIVNRRYMGRVRNPNLQIGEKVQFTDADWKVYMQLMHYIVSTTDGRAAEKFGIERTIMVPKSDVLTMIRSIRT